LVAGLHGTGQRSLEQNHEAKMDYGGGKTTKEADFLCQEEEQLIHLRRTAREKELGNAWGAVCSRLNTFCKERKECVGAQEDEKIPTRLEWYLGGRTPSRRSLTILLGQPVVRRGPEIPEKVRRAIRNLR